MFFRWSIPAPMVLTVCAIHCCVSAQADTQKQFRTEIEPILSQVCYDCHADGMDKGDFMMDDYEDLSAHLSDIPLWHKVWENLRAETMPPAEKTQPTVAERQQVLRWIEKVVFRLDEANPDPGRVTLRRLNRVEYAHTIKDLLDVDFDTEESLPPDDTGYGFDTIGDVLTLSPMLMEKYVNAAQIIVAEAIRPQEPQIPVYSTEGDKYRAAPPSKKNARFLPFSQAETVASKQVLEHAGKYEIKIECRTQGSSEATSHSAKLKIIVNGQEVDEESLGWDNRKTITLSTTAAMTEGENVIQLAMREDSLPLEDEKPLSLVIHKVMVRGPLDGRHKVYPRDYYRVFFKGGAPTEPKAREAYARDILRRLADRAFRRPVEDATLDRLILLWREASSQPKAKFEDGIAHATVAMLASPKFLFRAEVQPEPDNPAKIVPLDEFALASRLSYFLWSSLPDDELLDLARANQLRASLDEQVDRMLADPKAERFVSNFIGQWLLTRDVEGVNVDPRRVLGIRDLGSAFKVFGARQRRAMKQETEMLFAHLLKENRSALELFTADYTFLNESLAKLYGIEGVKGDEMRKVSLPAESKRGGILTHGSLLVVTSNPTRTSPVKRGLFVMESLLGSPHPPAPPDVPTLEEVKKGKPTNMTMREMMVLHREKPLCASCHARFDDVGLALENFNAVGMFRALENGQPIDTSGKLITGESFQSVQDLNRIIATSRRLDFYRSIAEKLLTYTIGRGMEYYDAPTINRIVAAMEKDGGKMKTLIRAVIDSAPFQKRRGDGARH
jgi:hypothetical protein